MEHSDAVLVEFAQILPILGRNSVKNTWPDISINASKIIYALWMVLIKTQIWDNFWEQSRKSKPYLENLPHNKIPKYCKKALFYGLIVFLPIY